ncbi:unnamed protein product [Darwinula stevensoni]|uniref:Probable imidazolonepropionase n=1 Tax=Darwinula stevensoni TaxID=69355 RepID=A0A7R8WZQ7_9CRUS|nr:unnamed protein product [Darwinula stevensoni]CAG0880295.1 unnamed protein product [Darwinula stevensoni]
MAHLPQIDNAWLHMKRDRIVDFGAMDTCPKLADIKGKKIDCTGKMVLPCWCDSHSHIVFAAYREEEFIYKVKGMTYEEIAAKGGGILNSARRLAEATEEELFQSAWKRLQSMIRLGTGALEIKSGYGLTTESELKMLRVIKRLKAESPIPIKATFLGAHSLPPAYKNDRAAYISLIINEMMPAIARDNLADYCDVFCERGFFTPEETAEIVQAGARHGMKAKIHANQLDYSGGVQVGVANGAISVDHLEHCGEGEIAALQGSNTMPTLLPSCAFFINLPFPPARALMQAGLPVTLATDYNPGSTPSGNMQFVVSLACIKMKMLPEEAINAATINGARAMELEHLVGSIEPGKRANVIITKPIPSLAYIPYAFGEDVVEEVVINGRIWGKAR